MPNYDDYVRRGGPSFVEMISAARARREEMEKRKRLAEWRERNADRAPDPAAANLDVSDVRMPDKAEVLRRAMQSRTGRRTIPASGPAMPPQMGQTFLPSGPARQPPQASPIPPQASQIQQRPRIPPERINAMLESGAITPEQAMIMMQAGGM